MITTPFGLYDCDVPMDASIAVIVSAAETAADLAKPPVFVKAAGTQVTERFTWHQAAMSHEPQTLGPSAHLWSRTTLRPSDVQVAELYDGFTFTCLSWLKALGFCGIGEAADFVAGGRGIAREGGTVALNTHGGQLSAGRTHGFGLIHEAVVQLRGEGGARQVPGLPGGRRQHRRPRPGGRDAAAPGVAVTARAACPAGRPGRLRSSRAQSARGRSRPPALPGRRGTAPW
jgi:acetyl-CoA acetyltransferase